MRLCHIFSVICLVATAHLAAADGPFLTTLRAGPAVATHGPLGIAAGLETQLNSQDYSGKTEGDPLPVSFSLDAVVHSRFTNFPLLINLRLDPNRESLSGLPTFFEFGVGAQMSTGDEGSGLRFAYGISVGTFLNANRRASLELRYYGSSNSATNSVALLAGFRI